MIDILAGEGHFLDHLLPVWRALPDDQRGTVYVEPDLDDLATQLGVPHIVTHLGPRAPTTPAPDRTPVLVASYGDIKKARRQGRTRIAFIEHGIGQSYAGVRDRRAERHASYAGGADRQDVGLSLVPNDHAAARFRTYYPHQRVEVVGSPHAEALPSRQPGPGPVVAISFHWACHIVPETVPAWGHYRPAVPALAARYQLLGHSHPRAWGGMSRLYRRLGVEPVHDFDEVCRRADVYVCDNSSSLYEFAATGRPVVVLNAPHYRRHVEHGLRFWQAATVGVQVDHPGDLVAAVGRALELRPADVAAREAALNLVYGHRSGAAARAAAALLDWANDRAVAA